METLLVHKIALDPTEKQKHFFVCCAGIARFSYNRALNEHTERYEIYKAFKEYKPGNTLPYPNIRNIEKKWNAIKGTEFPWVYDYPKDCNIQPIKNFVKAIDRFFKGKAKYPKHKKKGVKDSFYLSNHSIRGIEDSAIKLPKIGWVKMRENLRFEGKIMSVTVKREADRWFAFICVKTKVEQLPPLNKEIGIDLGLKTTITCSDGSTYNSPKPLNKHLKHLKRLHKSHSRKKKGSNNKKKSARKLARKYKRISNIRKDWTHKVTTKLIRENQTICLEDLSVKGMMNKKMKLSKSLHDTSFYEIRRQLEYKAKLYGRTIKIVDRFYPSSQLCSNCGAKNTSLKLSNRIFNCCGCGLSLNRDLNAAINIRKAAGLAVTACGQESSGISLPTDTKLCLEEAGSVEGS